MTEPFPSTETPQPFAPQPAPSALGGCSRPVLVGCGVLVVFLGIAALVLVLKAGDLFGWAMARFEAEIVAALPDDVSQEERERLSQAFAAATEAVQSGRADPLALQRLQGQLRETALKSGETLTRAEVVELIRSLEEVAGAEAIPQEEPAGAEGRQETAHPRAGPPRQRLVAGLAA